MRAGFDIGFYLLKQSPGSQDWEYLNTSPFSSAAGVHAASSILDEIYDVLLSLNIQIEEVISCSLFGPSNSFFDGLLTHYSHVHLPLSTFGFHIKERLYVHFKVSPQPRSEFDYVKS